MIVWMEYSTFLPKEAGKAINKNRYVYREDVLSTLQLLCIMA